MEEYVCPHCGNVIEDEEALMCLYCGEDLQRGVGNLGKIRYSSHWMLVTAVVLLVLGVIFLIVAG